MRQAVHRSHQEKPSIFSHLFFLVRIVFFIIFTTITGALLVSLITYSPSDPAWSSALQSQNVNNWLGMRGALFSDIIITSLGKTAYLFPVILMAYAYQIFIKNSFKNINIEIILVRLFGILLLILAFAGLLDIVNSTGGAIGKWIGSEFTKTALSWFGKIVSNPMAVIMASKIFLSLLILISLIMITGAYPLYWFEYTGKIILSFIQFFIPSKKKIEKLNPKLTPIESFMEKDDAQIHFLKNIFSRFIAIFNTPKKNLKENNFAPIDVAEILKNVEKASKIQNSNIEPSIDITTDSDDPMDYHEEPIYDIYDTKSRPTIAPRYDRLANQERYTATREIPNPASLMQNNEPLIDNYNIEEEIEATFTFRDPKNTSKILDLNTWANSDDSIKAEPIFVSTKPSAVASFSAIDDDQNWNSTYEPVTEEPHENQHSEQSPIMPSLRFGQTYYQDPPAEEAVYEVNHLASSAIISTLEKISDIHDEHSIDTYGHFTPSSYDEDDNPTYQSQSSYDEATTPVDSDGTLNDYNESLSDHSYEPLNEATTFSALDEPIKPTSSFSFISAPLNTRTPEEPSFQSLSQNGALITSVDILEPQITMPVRDEKPTGFNVDPRSGMPIPSKPKKIFPNAGLLPTPRLLGDPPPSMNSFNEAELTLMASQIEKQLKHFNVEVTVAHIDPGPVITRFELDLAPGVKVAQINNLSKDIARALSVTSVRVVDIIPGKPYVGLEIPNVNRETVYFKEGLFSPEFCEANHPLTIILGKDISGKHITANLAKMPHLLVAGTTGSGKSVGINTMLLSLLFNATPEEVRLILIDPKMLELSVYNDIPHLLAPVVTDMKESANALRWCVAEMERRYFLMSNLKVRNIAGYNKKVKDALSKDEPILDPTWNRDQQVSDYAQAPALSPLPYIVVVIDEFADMMMLVGKKCEELIARLAQKARASGIHLILATQRPSVDVITGLIKANIPTRIAFQVSSRIDSRTIIDQQGAETLLGHGDMLYLPPGSPLPIRVHGAFIDDHEVNKVVDFLKTTGDTNYISDILKDPTEPIPGLSEKAAGVSTPADDSADALFDEAVRIVLEDQRASISYVQRRLRVGYQRAARLIEEMERQGFISAPETNGNRTILVARYEADA